MRIEVVKSERNNKRFKAIFINKNGEIITTKHFGSPSGKTYIDHGDKSIRTAYIARHANLPGSNFYNLLSSAALSRWILWGHSKDMQKNIDMYNSKLNSRYLI